MRHHDSNLKIKFDMVCKHPDGLYDLRKQVETL